MLKEKYFEHYVCVSEPNDIELEFFLSKRNKDMVKTTRRISTKTCREMKEILKSMYNVDVSLGSVMNLQPFYVQTATEREKESCLCKFCLNIGLKYNVLLKHLKADVELIHSLSEYFGYGVTCPKDVNGYFQIKCIASECDNLDCSSSKARYTNKHFDLPNVDVKYNQFVVENFGYTNQKNTKINVT